eukprot:CAMPEP_0180060278 /NCGR_PEP_ID=MMETSP0985-20121206/5978_1 /TAXON_ID=483367 /ORGANISM="non described non described, Strain CCMP 2436" /LENGTH=54 /DNA_ID=CAMNT_0021990333 /DNA_START=129 /DNA_END=290 /DNA_ORIENTATION=+
MKACAAVPWTDARVEPGQRIEVPIPSSNCARVCCERALPVVDQLLEDAHVADAC